MKLSDIRSGYALFADTRFITIYQTQEEAEDHIKFQQETMQSNAIWTIVPINVNFAQIKHYKK